MNRILVAAIAVAACVAALSGCAPDPISVQPSTAFVPCAPGAVEVGGDAASLQAALDAAVPGAVLQLAPTVYHGRFRASVVATADAPITLCGSQGSVLDGGEVIDGYALHLEGAAYWDVRDFAVQGGQKGVVLDATTHTTLSGLAISDVGQEGLHLRAGSADNTVRSVTIERTGLTDPEFGEGVYVGSAESNWCRYSSCDADRSDRNTFTDLAVSDTTAEALDVKEGTTGGVVRDSSLSTGTASVVDSVVDLKGSDWRFEGNTVEGSEDAVSIHVILEPWGSGNVVAGNVLHPAAGGVGVTVAGAARNSGNVVACDNTVPSGASLTDVACA